MTNRYALTEEVKQKYTPIVEAFISQLELVSNKEANSKLISAIRS